jgi:hypothetical protein
LKWVEIRNGHDDSHLFVVMVEIGTLQMNCVPGWVLPVILMTAIHDGDNAAELQILAPRVVFQAPGHKLGLPEVKAKCRTRLRLGFWYLEQISVIPLLMNYQMVLLPLIVQQQRLFQVVLAVIFILK